MNVNCWRVLWKQSKSWWIVREQFWSFCKWSIVAVFVCVYVQDLKGTVMTGEMFFFVFFVKEIQNTRRKPNKTKPTTFWIYPTSVHTYTYPYKHIENTKNRQIFELSFIWKNKTARPHHKNHQQGLLRMCCTEEYVHRNVYPYASGHHSHTAHYVICVSRACACLANFGT